MNKLQRYFWRPKRISPKLSFLKKEEWAIIPIGLNQFEIILKC